jgi:hypothetical protein
MEPNSFGKKLGIGMRVAGNIARDRASAAARARETLIPPGAVSSGTTSQAARTAQTKSVASAINTKDIARKAEEVAARGRNLGKGIGRGSRQFSQSFFKPFAHASSVLWLEITGCFFALFAMFFAQNLYKIRAQYVAGPEHRTFLLYCFLTVIFLYFSASSFIKARRRSRKQAAGR